MIVDFTVTNFRSIQDEQIFSLYVETAGTHLSENVSYPAGDKIGVLKSAGIYGANASGKSNLLLAFRALQYIVEHSGDLKEGNTIAYEPYLLSEDNRIAPTHFEIEFFVTPENKHSKPLRYRYSVAFTAQKIVEESLFFYPTTQQAMIFSRTIVDTWETIRFGSLYKGGKKRLPFFENNSYLSKAGNSADAPQMIREVYNFFRSYLFPMALNETSIPLNWFEEKELVKQVAGILSLVDTGISDVIIRERTNLEPVQLPLPPGIPEEFRQLFLQHAKYKILFSHQTETGDHQTFEIGQESDGTRRFFFLVPVLIGILAEGRVLIIDELESSMHPFMAELIIKLFNDPRVNKKNAQLIFSTHNINLMTPELLRRDQIWFTEKQHGATKFYSLDDFDKKKVKPQSPFNQWYAEGRFGAIPNINYQGIVELFNSSEDEHAKKA